MEEDIFNHSTKKIEDVLRVLVRSPRVRDAIRKEYRRRAAAVIAELREGYQGKEADRDELESLIRDNLCDAPAVEEYEVELSAGPYPISVYGVKGAYFVTPLEEGDVGWFTTLADARDFVAANWGACHGFRRWKRA